MADAWTHQQQPLAPSTTTTTNTTSFSASALANSPADSAHIHPRIRRRNRLITSCLECRRRKLKCDKTSPCCANCLRFSRDCLYLAGAAGDEKVGRERLADMKERVGVLERKLEREVKGRGGKAHRGGANITRAGSSFSSASGASGVGSRVGAEGGGRESMHTHVEAQEDEVGVEEEEEDEALLEPTPLAALDNVYEDNNDDELMDLGVQMGKMRISERVGGWIRPKLVDELNDTLKDVMSGRSRWSAGSRAGPSGGGAELEGGGARGGEAGVAAAATTTAANPGPRIQASPKSYIGPGPDYIAPASSFFFPGTDVKTSWIDYLPTKSAADQLVAQYFVAVHYMCRTVHRPTFEAQYTLFWSQIATGNEPTPSIQAIMFAAMFSAAVSLEETQVVQRFGTSRAALVDSLRSGAELALAKANFLRTTRVDVMQAFVMYLIPLIRAEVSRAHSALVGTAIRLAECMGLHRDGLYYSMAPVEVHVRRLVWHQLCFLDMRTCEATGPRPQIRPGDYDTRFPLNIDDAELLADTAPTEDRPYWTDGTLMRIRCEAVDLRRSLWFDMVQIDKKKKSLTSVLVKVQKTWNTMTTRYFAMMNEAVPFHVLSKHILTLGLQGCFIQVLHRYLFSTSQRMPDRLRQILIEAGLTQMENAIALETNAELAPWAWYRGAFNQYHSALLLMVEVYAYPMRKDAAKIWTCLDFIFDIPPHLSPKQKAELVITDLRDRMEVYHQMRKLKATTQMEERVGSSSKSSLQEKAEGAVPVPQQGVATAAALADYTAMPPANFSPPPPAGRHGSASSGSRQPSAAQGADVAMLMDDIDWAEWDQYFPIEQNTGELNIPDFDFNNFTGGFNSGSALDSATFAMAADAIPNELQMQGATQDMADVSFTPTYYPDPRNVTDAQRYRTQG
ncbi:hypothetical protein B0A50_01434 [Salinomyces thailandicus]|uniref:Zn(2)-C6 fungal-type domain-containing protein n=1 Tax=Salinomyces thailandicus TaxID=706561 RepID=A0A4U0UCD7_9PEZI|nr:hypothetical protein B0A50_01434 [Salinomyces thailandica]